MTRHSPLATRHSSLFDARVEQPVEQVGREVERDDQRGDDNGGALHDGVVARLQLSRLVRFID
jgi:hypothetical protein